jgi:hypothetical protein
MLLGLENQPLTEMLPANHMVYQWRFYVLQAKKDQFRKIVPEMLTKLNHELPRLEPGVKFCPLSESLLGTDAGQFILAMHLDGFKTLDNQDIFATLGKLHSTLADYIDFTKTPSHNVFADVDFKKPETGAKTD